MDYNVLELSDWDRALLRAIAIQVPDDAQWELDGGVLSDEKLTYDEALAVLDRAIKQKQRETDATGFADPEAI